MSYTYLQEHLTIKQNSVLLIDEKMHTMPNRKRSNRIPQINTRPVKYMVSGLRARVSKRNLQERPNKTEGKIRQMESSIRRPIFKETEGRASEILRNRDCEKIQNIQTRSAATNRHRRINVQGVWNLLRYDEAASSQKPRSLSRNRENTRVSLLSM